MIAGVSTSGASFPLPSWLVGFAIVVFIVGGVVTIWKVLWPLLKTTTALVEQLPFFKEAQAKHEALEERVDDHEARISVLESARK